MWSLCQLMHGRTFEFDCWGAPTSSSTMGLANGWRAVYVGTKGDQQYIKKAFAFEGSWVSQRICFACKACYQTKSRTSQTLKPPLHGELNSTSASCQACQDEKSPFLYTHHGRDAAHRATPLDPHHSCLHAYSPLGFVICNISGCSRMPNSSWQPEDPRTCYFLEHLWKGFFLIISTLWIWPWLQRRLLQIRSCKH